MQNYISIYYAESPKNKLLLSTGQCLLQLILKENSPKVDFNYNQNEGEFIINNQNKYKLKHSSNCPCLNRIKSQIPSTPVQLATIAIIQDSQGQFLLTRRHPSLRTFPCAWVFPGGKVEIHQNLEQECLREVEEETGINIKQHLKSIDLKLLYESTYPTQLDEDQQPKRQTLCLFYEVLLNDTAKNIKIKVQETEVDDYRWISLENMKLICSDIIIEQYQEIVGIYPNKLNSGLGEGHLIAFKEIYINQE